MYVCVCVCVYKLFHQLLGMTVSHFLSPQKIGKDILGGEK